ncbi:MAG: hypothetical protein ACYCZW_03025 [Minisyncoccota bacterium]
MFNTLEKLRTKSKAERTFVAFSISLLITGLIFVIWFTADKRSNIATEDVKNIESNTPTDTLFKNISDMWGSVVNTTQQAKETIKSIDMSSTVEYTKEASTTEN